MATIVEDMDTDAAAAPQSTAPVALDDASLERLAAMLRPSLQPTRPAWQTSLLITVAGALIAAATAGYLSLRGDIASLGTSLRAEIAAGDASLRAEIASVDSGLRAEIASVEENLRAEIAAGDASLRAEIASVEENLRAEIASVDSGLRAEIASVEESLRTELREFRAEFNEVALDHTERLARLEAAHPHPAAN